MRSPAAGRLLLLSPLLAALLLSACGTAPKLAPSLPPAVKPSPAPGAKTPAKPEAAPALPAAGSGRGGYYQDDGPGDNPPPNLDQVPDADVRNDPLLPYSNRPYVVFGKTYTPITDNKPFTQIGIGSWYGKKFHGQRTSSGELYDMYKMTAAHPTLPIPSYARLTNLVSGAVVVVRINDRGPFHSSRAIDVSYTAALKLGLLGKGSHQLQIERILPDEIDRMLATRAGVSASTRASLQVRPSRQAETLSASNSLSLTPSLSLSQPLVLSPAPVQALTSPANSPANSNANAAAPAPPPAARPAPAASAASPEIETLMLADRAPAAASTAAGTGGSEAAKSGFYLQLGAYSRADNAETARAKLAKVSGIDTLEVTQGGSVFRLFSGPYASRQDALQAAQGLPSTLGLKPIVIQK
jgi:rare lipoprotein A